MLKDKVTLLKKQVYNVKGFVTKQCTDVRKLQSFLHESLLDRVGGRGVCQAVLLHMVHLLVTLRHLPNTCM